MTKIDLNDEKQMRECQVYTNFIYKELNLAYTCGS